MRYDTKKILIGSFPEIKRKKLHKIIGVKNHHHTAGYHLHPYRYHTELLRLRVVHHEYWQDDVGVILVYGILHLDEIYGSAQYA